MQFLILISSLLFLACAVTAQNNLPGLPNLSPIFRGPSANNLTNIEPNLTNVNLTQEGFGAFPFAIPFSRIPSPCVCSQQYCTCCANIDLQPFALNQRACFNISYDPRRLSASLSGNVNQRWGFQNSISASNPPPFCFPIFIPGEVICITYSNVVLQPTRFQACLDISVRLLFMRIFNFNFDCLEFSLDQGFSVVKPSDLTASPAR